MNKFMNKFINKVQLMYLIYKIMINKIIFNQSNKSNKYILENKKIIQIIYKICMMK